MNAIEKKPAGPAGEFGALSAAVHPAWHQAILRLANASERIAFRLEAFMGTPIDGGMARHARALVKDLIDFLDQLDADPDLEPSFGSIAYGYGPQADECEPPEDAEPSLGSFDRMTNQEKSYRQVSEWCLPPGSDLEHDGADNEPSLGSCDPSVGGGDQTRWASGCRDDREQDGGDTGIADRDGLLEQIGQGDWTQTVMG